MRIFLILLRTATASPLSYKIQTAIDSYGATQFLFIFKFTTNEFSCQAQRPVPVASVPVQTEKKRGDFYCPLQNLTNCLYLIIVVFEPPQRVSCPNKKSYSKVSGKKIPEHKTKKEKKEGFTSSRRPPCKSYLVKLILCIYRSKPKNKKSVFRRVCSGHSLRKCDHCGQSS